MLRPRSDPANTVMNITCGAAYNGSDKTFQFNGRGEMRISNFYASNAGKLVRSCGDCTGNGGPRKIFVNNVITRDVPTIVGINSNFGDVATIRNLTLRNSGTSKTKICQVYKGVVPRRESRAITGSAVTAQELDSSLSPTGKQYSYQVTSDLGEFSPTSNFTSQYIGVSATGYYFDEVLGAVSSGPVTLNGYSDLSVDTVMNVNILTTLAYQRIRTLAVQPGKTFSAARTQAEQEVLSASQDSGWQLRRVRRVETQREQRGSADPRGHLEPVRPGERRG